MSFPPSHFSIPAVRGLSKCGSRMESIVSHVKAGLGAHGLDICEPFPVLAYNRLASRFPLPLFGRENAVAFVVGSTKTFWPHFEEYVRSFGEDELPKNPIDSFHQFVLEKALKENEVLAKIEAEIRYDWNVPRSGKFVHVQTAGHVAGFALYDKECQWSCHPVFGLWFTYRAVIVLDSDWQGPEPAIAPNALTPEVKEEIKHWSEVANEEKWQNRQTRLRIRDCCPIGKELYRYDGECMKYFFPIEETTEQVLNRIRSKENTSSSQTNSNTSSSTRSDASPACCTGPNSSDT